MFLNLTPTPKIAPKNQKIVPKGPKKCKRGPKFGQRSLTIIADLGTIGMGEHLNT